MYAPHISVSVVLASVDVHVEHDVRALGIEIE